MASCSRSSLTLLVATLGSLLVLPRQALAQDNSPGGSTFPDTIWNCSGWHTVVKDDGCWSIEQQFNITSQQFTAWNPSVSADCGTNFWPGYAYCVRVGAPGPTLPGIAANCNKWHTVTTNEGCWDIEQANNITAAQFFAWNPAVSSDCNTNFWPTYSYCVGINANVKPTTTSSSATTSSSTSTSTSSIVTTTTPYSTRHPVTSYNLTTPYTATANPPQHTPAGQPSNCNRWHWVAMGDTCQGIVNLYGSWLTNDELHQYNPTLGDDCGGLYYGWYVCVGVQPTTSSYIAWSTSQSGNASIPDPTAFVPPVATFVPDFTASPVASGVPSSCQNFYMAENGDTCNTVLGIYDYITKDQFFAWNPALQGNCNGLLIGVYYCVANFGSTAQLMPPTVTASASPIATGTTGTCTAWYLAVGSDDCSSIALLFGTFSQSDFISWNPSVGSDCSGIQESVYYCVAVPGTPTSRTAAPPTTPSGSLPTQSGVIANCTQYWLVSLQDTCDSIVASAGIAKSDLLSWNPALGTDCKGLTPNYYLCVSTATVTDAPTSTVTLPADGSRPTTTSTPPVTGSPTTTTTTKAPTTTSQGSAPVATPSPAFPSMVDGCVRFWFRGADQGNLYCYDIAAAAGVSLTDFVSWNPNVKSDCSGLWALTWYCIGVSGPQTTISTGPPVPAKTGA